MAHAFDGDCLKQGEHGLDIDHSWGEQRLAQREAVELGQRRCQIAALHVEHAAHKRKAVGVQAARGKRQQHVSGGGAVFVGQAGLVCKANGKPREVIFLLGVKARHLGRLPADEGGARLHAALGHARHNFGDALRDVFAAGDVVEEEERPCSAAHNVVDAHGHAVDAHGVVLVEQKGEFEFGADAVGSAHQHRLLNVGKVEAKEAAKAAHVACDAGGDGARHMALHELHGAVSRRDIDARGGIAFRLRLIHKGYSFPLQQ